MLCNWVLIFRSLIEEFSNKDIQRRKLKSRDRPLNLCIVKGFIPDLIRRNLDWNIASVGTSCIRRLQDFRFYRGSSRYQTTAFIRGYTRAGFLSLSPPTFFFRSSKSNHLPSTSLPRDAHYRNVSVTAVKNVNSVPSPLSRGREMSLGRNTDRRFRAWGWCCYSRSFLRSESCVARGLWAPSRQSWSYLSRSFYVMAVGMLSGY